MATPPAAELLDAYGRTLAVGIADLQRTLSLDFHILHGDRRRAGGATRSPPRPGFVPMRPDQEILIARSGTGDNSTALRGAAGLVISDHLKLVI